MKLFDGTEIPNIIDITKRIFEVKTYDGDIVLCNVETTQKLIKLGLAWGIRYYDDGGFHIISKKEILEINLK